TAVHAAPVEGNKSSALLSSFPGFQLPPHQIQHCQVAGQSADDIGDRLCRQHAIDAQIPEMGQKQNQRNAKNHLPEQREKDSLLRLSKAHKNILARVLEGHKHKEHKMNAQRQDSHLKKLLLPLKQPDKLS